MSRNSLNKNRTNWTHVAINSIECRLYRGYNWRIGHISMGLIWSVCSFDLKSKIIKFSDFSGFLKISFHFQNLNFALLTNCNALNPRITKLKWFGFGFGLKWAPRQSFLFCRSESSSIEKSKFDKIKSIFQSMILKENSKSFKDTINKLNVKIYRKLNGNMKKET